MKAIRRSRSAGSRASKTPSAPPRAGRTPSGSSSIRRAPGTSRRSGQRQIIARSPAGIATVGVFVNREAEEVERTVDDCGLDLIQLHGDESPEYCRRFPPERVIKAVFPRTPEELRALDAYDVRAFLVDARDAGRYGGTGKRADWELAARTRKDAPPDPRRRSRHRRTSARRWPPSPRRPWTSTAAASGRRGSRITTG